MTNKVTHSRQSLSLLTCMIGVALAGCHATMPLRGPNLEWDGAKVYSSGSVPYTLAGFGVGAVIDQLPLAAPSAVTITRMITNSGNETVPAGYQINETVQLMQFTAVGGSAGFTPAPVPPVTNQTVLGPALAPGDSVPVSFTVPIPACGLYLETLTVDFAGAVAETQERDNVGLHYFSVAGSMRVNITVTPNNSVSLWHANAGPAPPWAVVAPAFPATTHSFTIAATTPGTTFHYSYYQPIVNGSLGATGQLIGPAPVTPPSLPVAGPVTISHQVSARTHNVPATDILFDAAFEHFLPRVTAITGDGCEIRQQTAQVSVVHP